MLAPIVVPYVPGATRSGLPDSTVRVDLGCGRQPVAGTFGVDVVALPGVAVVARLGTRPLPFRDRSIDQVYALNVLEHLEDLPAAMAEIYRVLRPGGRLNVEVPYFSSVNAFADPTHRRWFTYTTFEHFAVPTQPGWQANRYTWFARQQFQLISRRLDFGRLHRTAGLMWLANWRPALYEHFLAYTFPARVLHVVLERPSGD